MKAITSILLLFIFFNIAAQERVTNITSAGTGNRVILKEIENVNYVITINNADLVTVFTESGDMLTELHKQKFTGSSQNNDYSLTGKYLLFSDQDGSIAYDFVENEFILYPYDSQYNNTFWSHMGENIYRLGQYGSNVEWHSQIVDFNTLQTIQIPDSFRYEKVTATHILKTKLITYDSVDYSIVERATGQEFFLMNGKISHEKSVLTDNDFIFYNDNKIFKLNLDTKISTDILDIAPNISTPFMYKLENGFAIYIRNDIGNNKLLIFNSQASLTHQFEINFSPNDIYPRVLQGKLLIDDNELISLDLSTNEIIKFEAGISDYKDMAISEDRYVYSKQFDKLNIIDLLTGQESSYDGFDWFGWHNGISLINSKDRVYINFDNNDNSLNTLYEFDGSFRASSLLEDDNAGLWNESKLISNSEQLVLVDRNVYTINSDSYQIRNEGVPYESNTIRGVASATDIEDVSWVETHNDNGTDVLKLHILRDGQVIVSDELRNISADILASDGLGIYRVLEDKVYYRKLFSSNYSLYELDINSGSYESIHTPFLQIFEQLFTADGKVFFISSGKLHIKTPNSDAVNLDIPMIDSYSMEHQNLPNETIIKSDNGLYSVKGNQATLLDNIDNLVYYLMKKAGENIYYKSTQGVLSVYDGNQVSDIAMPTNSYTPRTLDSENIIIEIHDESIETKRLILHIPTLQIINLPEAMYASSFIGTTKIGQRSFAITSDNRSGPSIIRFYEFEGLFENLAEVLSFNHSGSYPSIDIVNIDNGILGYIGSTIFSIDNNLQLNIYQDLIGESWKSKFHKLDDFNYFIAIDQEEGRQVFRIKDDGLEGPNSVLTHSNIEFSVYPIPSLGIINIDTGKATSGIIRVLSNNGEEVLCKKISGTHISSLNIQSNGLYIIQLIKEDGTVISKKAIVIE